MKEKKYCCKQFEDAIKRCDIFHKIQYGTNGAKYSWGYYTDYGEHVLECPSCNMEIIDE